MSEHDDAEFDELLAALHSCHTPEQFEEFAARISELISAVRQARKERDANLQFALAQHNCTEAVATVATIVLHELDTDGVQNSTHSLLAATLAAYGAGATRLSRCERD